MELGVTDPVPALNTPAISYQLHQCFWGGVTWTPETDPALMRASLPARIGQEKLHESHTPQPRADHSQAAHC